MRLPHSLKKLQDLRLASVALISAIYERRQIIRYHRDQKLDDRCWLDDYLVWEMLDDSKPRPTALPDQAEMKFQCRYFYVYRSRPKADRVPKGAIKDKCAWDDDLMHMDQKRLLAELYSIQRSIRDHRDIRVRGCHRTYKDDRFLYGVLPEKMPADFRLPPIKRFLGEAAAPHAGCPSFWRSHSQCSGRCNIHAWGPCRPVQT